MSRILTLLTVLFLLFAVDAFAHCKKCANDLQGCLMCADTDFDAYSTCELRRNGTECATAGYCEGPGGDGCPHFPCPAVKWVDLFPSNVKLQRDWQLVSVKVLHVTPATKERKRGA